MSTIIEEPLDFPALSKDLINFLDESYPHRCLRSGEDVVAHHRYAGIRELIDELLVLLDEHENGDSVDD